MQVLSNSNVSDSISQLSSNDLVQYYSFFKKPLVQHNNSQVIKGISDNHQAVFIPNQYKTEKINRNLQQKNNWQEGHQLTPRSLLSKKSSRVRCSTSSNRLSGDNKNSLSQLQLKSVSQISSSNNDQSGQIYEKIIKVIQDENKNLKEYNKYLLKQCKKMKKQNQFLRAQFVHMEILTQLQIENQGLKNLHEVYKKEIRELKDILMGEIMGIHHKLREIANTEGPQEFLAEFNQSLKSSEFFSGKPDFFMNNEEIFAKKSANLALSELLQLNDSSNFERKFEQKCEETTKLNDFSSNSLSSDSPAQTTFSGQLRLSSGGQQSDEYNKDELEKNLQEIINQKINSRN